MLTEDQYKRLKTHEGAINMWHDMGIEIASNDQFREMFEIHNSITGLSEVISCGGCRASVTNRLHDFMREYEKENK